VPRRVNEIESRRKGASDEVDFTVMNRLKGPVIKKILFLRDLVVAFLVLLLSYTVPVSGALLQFMLSSNVGFLYREPEKFPRRIFKPSSDLIQFLSSEHMVL
jgi:hypothetical protein